MRSPVSNSLKAVLCSTICLSVAACGGGGGGGSGGGVGGIGIIPIIPIFPLPTLNRGVIAYTSVNADAGSSDFGGQGTTVALTHWNGVGDYTVTFTGSYPGVTSRDDVAVFATAEHTTNFHVASASMDLGDANSTTIVVRVFTYTTAVFPHVRDDVGFSVMVTRGLGALGISGYANIEGEGVVPTVPHFGGSETTDVYAARNSLGHYTVSFEGNYPGATSMDDFAVLVSINDDDYLEVASADVLAGTADSTHVRFKVAAWSSVVVPPVYVDTSFSVLVLRRGTTPAGIRGFASIDGWGASSVLNFGGSETTNVTVAHPITGFYTVIFTGTFSSVTTGADITAFAAVSHNVLFDVASISSVTASPTTIRLDIWVWSDLLSPSTLSDRDFTIVIPK